MNRVRRFREILNGNPNADGWFGVFVVAFAIGAIALVLALAGIGAAFQYNNLAGVGVVVGILTAAFLHVTRRRPNT